MNRYIGLNRQQMCAGTANEFLPAPQESNDTGRRQRLSTRVTVKPCEGKSPVSYERGGASRSAAFQALRHEFKLRQFLLVDAQVSAIASLCNMWTAKEEEGLGAR